MFGFRNKKTDCSDEELMRQITYGNQDAFNTLYNRYSNRLLYYFYRMLGSSNEKAQDFLQDIFIKLLDKADTFDTARKFSTWIFSIAHNMCKNEYRNLENKKTTVLEYIENTVADEAYYSQDTISDNPEIIKSFITDVFTELDLFDEIHKSAFLMRYREGFSMKEISQMLNISEGTVKSRLYYTKQKLSLRLSKYNPQTN